MRYILVVCIVLFVGVLGHNKIQAEYQRGFADALKSAYKTNPPSEELELICAGLWVGEQNKKHAERNK